MHNILSTNEDKNAIWQQIHLNFYTKYKYNIWHKQQKECPLCKEVPQDIYHIILECKFTKELWKQIEPFLIKLHQINVTDEEKAFGIAQKNQTIGVLLRNWLTYSLRQKITDAEKKAHYTKQIPNLVSFKQNFNHHIAFLVRLKIIRYRNENKLDLFDKLMTYSNILCIKGDNDQYSIADVFQ